MANVGAVNFGSPQSLSLTGGNHVQKVGNSYVIFDENGNRVRTLTETEKTQYMLTESKVMADREKIAELEGRLFDSSLSPSEKSNVSAQLAELREKVQAQNSTAKTEITPDGKIVSYALKSDVPVGEFREMFSLKEQALEGDLRQYALKDGYSKALGRPFSSFEEALKYGVTEFSNGVKLETDKKGEVYPNYDNAIMRGGETYSVSASNIVAQNGKNQNPFAALFDFFKGGNKQDVMASFA